MNDDALTNARQSLEALRGWIRNCLATRTHTQFDFGVSDTALRAFLSGGTVRAASARKIGRAASASAEIVEQAAYAATLLHREAMGRGWQARKARPPARHHRLPPSLTGRHYTAGGRWLRDEIFRRWESLNAFERDTGIDPWRTLPRYFFNGTFHPKRDVLQRIANMLNRRNATGDAVLTADALVSRFGCGESWEEWCQRTHPARACPICGKRRSRGDDTCGRACRSLRIILRHKLPTQGAKMLWALMAHAADVPPMRISDCLQIPARTVEDWITDLTRKETSARICDELQRGTPLLKATAKVLGLTRRALDEYVHHRAFRRGKHIAGRPRLSHRKTLKRLAAVLHVTDEECLAMFEREGQLEKALADRIQDVQRRRWRQPDAHGRPRSTCSRVRQIIGLRAEGLRTAEIAARLADAPDGRALSNNEVRWLPIRHARKRGQEAGCDRCRPLVAFDLYARGSSIRKIATRLGVGVGTVDGDLKRPWFRYGLLTTHEVATKAGISPDAVRWHADRKHIRCLRTRIGWRQFRLLDVEVFLRKRI